MEHKISQDYVDEVSVLTGLDCRVVRLRTHDILWRLVVSNEGERGYQLLDLDPSELPDPATLARVVRRRWETEARHYLPDRRPAPDVDRLPAPRLVATWRPERRFRLLAPGD